MDGEVSFHFLTVLRSENQLCISRRWGMVQGSCCSLPRTANVPSCRYGRDPSMTSDFAPDIWVDYF